MLVSAGVLFKHSSTTRSFRRQWMESVIIREVFNFTHVRELFFGKAISPFVAICFDRGKQNDFPIKYWLAKRSKVMSDQTILFSKQDIHTLRNEDFTSGKLWKTYSFGRLADASFLKNLRPRHRMRDFVDREKSGLGYKLASEDYCAEILAKYNALDIKSFSRYDCLSFEPPPEKVHRFGKLDAYSGKRLLIQRGISQKGKTNGRIEARYEKQKFCFSNQFMA